ncbi:MAG: hypothetical protein AB1540_01260 [Bdellovibrionota bacterium]
MKYALLANWCSAPWHAWLKEQPQWLRLWAEVWSKIPEPALSQILASPQPLVILPPVEMSQIVRIEHALPQGAFLLQMNRSLLDRPRDEAVAILAHELGHRCAKNLSSDPIANDLEADRIAISWGFDKGLIKALERDVCDSNPRLAAAKNKT